MNIWQYNRGNWEQIPDLMTYENGEKNDEEALTSVGFERYDSIASEGENTFEVWRKGDAFYLDLCTFSGGNAVFCPDFPSYLMFLKEFGSTFIANDLFRAVERLEGMAEKAFEAWHGHRASTVCRHCDRITYKRQQEESKELAARKKAKQNAA